MHDVEGTELKPGDIVEWLRQPGELYAVTKKQDAGEDVIRVKCLCQSCQDELNYEAGTLDIFYFKQHRVRLVERVPTPEYYKHKR